MKPIFPYLTYAGAIPFALGAIFLNFDITEIPPLGSVEPVLSVYGVMIASFMAGAHWGQHFQIKNRFWHFYLPVVSNIIVLVLWFSFLILSFKIFMAMLVLGFVALLGVDYYLSRINVITHHYFKTRLSPYVGGLCLLLSDFTWAGMVI